MNRDWPRRNAKCAMCGERVVQRQHPSGIWFHMCEQCDRAKCGCSMQRTPEPTGREGAPCPRCGRPVSLREAAG